MNVNINISNVGLQNLLANKKRLLYPYNSNSSSKI